MAHVRAQFTQPMLPGGKLFVWMLCIAGMAHLLVLGAMQLLPNVTSNAQAPRALFFKIGGGGVLAPALSSLDEVQPPPAPQPVVQKAAKAVKKIAAKPLKKTLKKTTKKQAQPAQLVKKEAALPLKAVTPEAGNTTLVEAQEKTQEESPLKAPKRIAITPKFTLDDTRKAPFENPSEEASSPQQEQEAHVPSAQPKPNLPSLQSLFHSVEQEVSNRAGAAAVEKSTQILAPAVGNTYGNSVNANAQDAEDEAIRLRYEQQISAWVARHRYYPEQAQGRTGRAVVRVRLDRQGYVRYYKVEESSGYAIFDSAAIDMVRRANPMPSVPNNYPVENLIEFLIPITFKP